MKETTETTKTTLTQTEKEDKKKVPRFRVFNIMQYLNHPRTGEALITDDNIISALQKKSITDYAYALHDKDVLENGEPKPPHYHIVINCDKSPQTIETIAKWFGIEPQYVETPRGKNAFWDCAEYLTHTNESSIEKGKHIYQDLEVLASFDYRREIEAHKPKKVVGRRVNNKQYMRHMVSQGGKTLKWCEEYDPIGYNDDISALTKLRNLWISKQPAPPMRVNFYLSGSAGMGKGLMSKALARAMFPDHEDPFFEVGSQGALFEGYDGQPVIIWNDFRAYDLLEKLGDRGNVFRVFDNFPGTARQNIKYGSINLLNSVHIVNSVQDYHSFLYGLVGSYKKADGTWTETEEMEVSQSSRRFPFIVNIEEEDYNFYVNKAFMYNTMEYTSYEVYEGIRGNIANVTKKLKRSPELLSKFELGLMRPLLDVYNCSLEMRKIDPTEDVIDISEFEGYGEITNKTLKELDKVHDEFGKAKEQLKEKLEKINFPKSKPGEVL